MSSAPSSAPPVPPVSSAAVKHPTPRPFAANVVRIGAPRAFLADLYHFLLARSWVHVLGLIATVYLTVNALFAGLYLLGDQCVEGARPGSFADAFFFSVQTMATIGYGKMAPATTYAHVLVSVEAFVGTLFVAMVTGLVFAKFSRPTARVLFSRNLVVSRRDGKRMLMIRLANARGNQIVEANLHFTFTRTERTVEGERIRRLYDLPLTRERNAIFALSWSAMHELTPQSPLYDATPTSLAEGQVQVIVSLIGLDETYAQTVSARHIYNADEILFNTRFVDILQPLAGGRAVIDYRKFHDTEPTLDSPP